MDEFKKGHGILDRINSLINSVCFMEESRLSACDFVRTRKLPFSSLIYFMLNSVKQTLQKELTCFFDKFSVHDNITKSAFCQQRIKLKPEAFVKINNMLIDDFYTDNIIKRWNSRRLLCIDSSQLEVPKSPDSILYFGVNNYSNMVPMAKISTLFDLKNEMILDSIIAPNRTSEYDLAISHFNKIKENDLIIMDRGYAARWLFYVIMQNRADFLVRIQHGFGNDVEGFWNSDETSMIIEVKEPPEKSKQRFDSMNIEFKPFKFRLVKVVLKTGETEVLATSLLDEQKYSTKIFKELYHQRWGVETNYAHLKNHIEIGNFTGYSTQIIQQDFYANALIANIQQLIIRDAQHELSTKTKHREYEYKINKNLSLGFMKDRVIEIFTSNDPEHYQKLVELFQLEPIPIRKNRKYPREKTRHEKRYYINQKRAI